MAGLRTPARVRFRTLTQATDPALAEKPLYEILGLSEGMGRLVDRFGRLFRAGEFPRRGCSRLTKQER